MLIKDDTADYHLPLLDDVKDGDDIQRAYAVRGTHVLAYVTHGGLRVEAINPHDKWFVYSRGVRDAEDARVFCESVRAHCRTSDLRVDCQQTPVQ